MNVVGLTVAAHTHAVLCHRDAKVSQGDTVGVSKGEGANRIC